MTLHQLLTNPSGRGTGDVGARFRIIDDLKKKYLALHKKFKFKFAAYEKAGRTVFYVQVPSETLNKSFYFDVLIEVDTLAKETKKSLLESPIKIFSNNMAFMFIYAYAANKDDLIIPWLKDKISEKALTQKPVVRNPNIRLGFEKSIFFASQFILDNRLFEKGKVKPVQLKEEELVDMIDDTETILQKYNKQKKFEAAKRKKERNRIRAAEARKKAIAQKKKKNTVKRTSSVRKVKTVKKAKKVKRANRK